MSPHRRLLTDRAFDIPVRRNQSSQIRPSPRLAVRLSTIVSDWQSSIIATIDVPTILALTSIAPYRVQSGNS
jgi:hypothetical protein